ncbi:hypothetical protein CW735_05035 [Alteromonas sp. MB-3u-76]|uniref:transketolase family protein n=1 Tax=Alteromonas sp. MB-3u-76 TaxID=2058133 RepID=UPI000C30B5D1|nr:transketolase C-terminal domain-containing protein [Alteromonas sp. MB-3u-76]AUC87643.1 hypothetical protein CW735_05035 [Alteromonas sp. MB-3u-76]
MSNPPSLIGKQGDSLREAFGKALVDVAYDRPEVVLLDADIAGGTGAHHFRTAFPDRFFQFGIAEQNMMSASAGMAQTGLIPIVTTFAVFCLRAIEQCRLSIAYQNQNVKIVASHPGLDTGPDGASAQCLEDLASFRAIPNMTVISPCDPKEMALATKAILAHEGPVYMRTGRSPSPTILPKDTTFKIGRATVLKPGSDVTIIATGVMVARALDAAEKLTEQGVKAKVVNMSTIKPIDSDTIIKSAIDTGAIVTAEDHNVIGGLGSAVAEVLVQNTFCPVEFVGVKDTFGESGEPDELATAYQIDAISIVEATQKVLKRKVE